MSGLEQLASSSRDSIKSIFLHFVNEEKFKSVLGICGNFVKEKKTKRVLDICGDIFNSSRFFETFMSIFQPELLKWGVGGLVV